MSIKPRTFHDNGFSLGEREDIRLTFSAHLSPVQPAAPFILQSPWALAARAAERPSSRIPFTRSLGGDSSLDFPTSRHDSPHPYNGLWISWAGHAKPRGQTPRFDSTPSHIPKPARCLLPNAPARIAAEHAMPRHGRTARHDVRQCYGDGVLGKCGRRMAGRAGQAQQGWAWHVNPR